jgi:hypothetical protein
MSSEAMLTVQEYHWPEETEASSADSDITRAAGMRERTCLDRKPEEAIETAISGA